MLIASHMGALVFSVANDTHGQVETTGATSSIFMPGIVHAYHVYRRTWTPFVGERLQSQQTKQRTRPIHGSSAQ